MGHQVQIKLTNHYVKILQIVPYKRKKKENYFITF